MTNNEVVINGLKVNVYSESFNEENWEDFMIEGQRLGEVKVLRHTKDEVGKITAGLWRHRPDEHPDGIPYHVEGAETFYVIKGSAFVETPNGERTTLSEGNVYSFTKGFVGTWVTTETFVKFFVEN